MIEFLINQYKNVPQWQIVCEFIAFLFGILSVFWLKRKHLGISYWAYFYNYNRLFAIQSKLFWRHDNEYLLFTNEFIWMVQMDRHNQKTLL